MRLKKIQEDVNKRPLLSTNNNTATIINTEVVMSKTMLEQPLLKIKVSDKNFLNVEVVNIQAIGVRTKDNKFIDKVVMMVKSPENEIFFKISDAEINVNGKIKQGGLWLFKDDDGNIIQQSNLANVMRFYNATSLKDLLGKKVTIKLNKQGYYILKAT